MTIASLKLVILGFAACDGGWGLEAGTGLAILGAGASSVSDSEDDSEDEDTESWTS